MRRATTGTWRSPTRSAIACWTATSRPLETIAEAGAGTKVVAYLSAEFLTGPHLGNSLINLGIWEATQQAVASARAGSARPARTGGGAGPRQRRPRPAGRLLHGFAGDPQRSGHRLRHPLRVRHLRSGDSRRLAGRADRQVAALRQSLGDRALGDHLRREVRRTDRALPRRPGAAPRRAGFPSGWSRASPTTRRSPAIACTTTNLLRLWKAEATESFDFEAFNVGDYYGAVDEKIASETISKVLYPNDEPEAGKQLRLAQQYFFVSCSLQDMIRLHLRAAEAARRVRRRTGPRS